MSIAQTIFTAIVSFFLLIAGCAALLAESKPDTAEGRALQIEMGAYVSKFVDVAGMDYNELQWSAVVIPTLAAWDAAMVYYWPLPERGEPVSTLAVFTFDAKRMQTLSPQNRRAVAAHEVGHVTLICQRIMPPDFTVLNDFEAFLAGFNYQVLNEGCADIVGAEMTSYREMLIMLQTLRASFVGDEVNYVLNQRILTLQGVIARGDRNHE